LCGQTKETQVTVPTAKGKPSKFPMRLAVVALLFLCLGMGLWMTERIHRPPDMRSVYKGTNLKFFPDTCSLEKLGNLFSRTLKATCHFESHDEMALWLRENAVPLEKAGFGHKSSSKQYGLVPQNGATFAAIEISLEKKAVLVTVKFE
jgi:hypothetical protein